jgi:hypothetical protein
VSRTFRTPENARTDVLAVIADHPAGLSTQAVAKSVRRRRADVLNLLEACEQAGVVERLASAGQAHARRWRLRTAAETPSGTAREQRQGTSDPQDGVTADSVRDALRTALSASDTVVACRQPVWHARWRWQAPGGRTLCALCTPPAVSTALRAASTRFDESERA